MRFRFLMISPGLGPGGRFCLWGGQKLKSFDPDIGGGGSLSNGGLFISK